MVVIPRPIPGGHAQQAPGAVVEGTEVVQVDVGNVGAVVATVHGYVSPIHGDPFPEAIVQAPGDADPGPRLGDQVIAPARAGAGQVSPKPLKGLLGDLLGLLCAQAAALLMKLKKLIG